MVEKESFADLGELNKKLSEAGYSSKIAIVDIDELQGLEKNARFMKHETFSSLKENIKRDGHLSSVPFCVKKADGKYKILSGNHRIEAARAASVHQVLIMYTDKKLTRQEEVAIQLSHNAIEGEDDPVILKELWDEIRDLELKQYSGLDDEALQKMMDEAISSMSEARLDFREVCMLFLPEEIERIKSILKNIKKTTSSEKSFMLGHIADYDRMMDALDEVKGAYNIFNSATSFMLILDIFEAHLLDLKDGWVNNSNRKRINEVPLSSVFGTRSVPATTAEVINKAVQMMRDKSEVPGKELWRCLEIWARGYLEAGGGKNGKAQGAG